MFPCLVKEKEHIFIVKRRGKMDVKTAIRLRQSVRKYKEGEVAEEDIRQILEAGRLAPSGKNLQNWHFIVIRQRALKEAIGQVIAEKNHAIASAMDEKDLEKGRRFRKFCKNFTLFYLEAPVLVLVYSCDVPPDGYEELRLIDTPYYDLNSLFQRSPALMNIGAALENINLQAIELGYGMCWMTGQNYAAKEIEKLIEEEIGFRKAGYFFTCMFTLGIAEDNLPSPPKKELEEIVTFV